MILPSLFFAIDTITTTPRDLVDRLFDARGFAAVAVSSVPVPIVVDSVERDEVRLTNLARARWGLTVESRTASARALRLAKGDFFSHYRQGVVARLLTASPSRMRQRGGTSVRVQDLLSGLQPPVTAHAFLLQRRVRVRTGEAGIEPALPAVARAVGGRWDANTRRIEFDPRAYREALLASVDDFAPSDDRIPDGRDLIRLGLSVVSDADLERAYLPEGGGTVQLSFAMTDVVRRSLGRYAESMQRLSGMTGSDFGNSIRRAFSEGWISSIVLSSSSGFQIRLRKPGSAEMIQF